MEREGFVKKDGASWHSTTRGSEFALWFREYPQPGVDRDYSYHVDRSRFDHLLFHHAQQLGSRTLQGALVKEVVFEDGHAVGVRYVHRGREKVLNARCVVDASGRSCTLGTQLRWKQKDPLFDQFAVHAWFNEVERGTRETADFIHIYFLPVKRGWAWQIPITKTTTSIGVVADRSMVRESRGRHGEWFRQMVSTSPDLRRATAGAIQATSFRIEAEYSYSMQRFTGDGFLLIGDAARFVDPIFSSGVSVACHSARFASESLTRALAKGDVIAERLQPYENRLRAGVDIWYEFICLYYRLMHLFTHFITDPDYRLQIVRLLQGDVFDRGSVPVLDRMREVIRTVEETPGHIWKPSLGDTPR